MPILTCHPACVTRCAITCYVINTMTDIRTSCRRCQARNTVLRRNNPESYYEYFFKDAERMSLPIRLSDGGGFESSVQVKVCIAAVRRHPSVHAIGYTKRIELLQEFVNAPDNFHMRYSSWEGDEASTYKARELGFSITEVVYDGSGNCPYQVQSC